MKEEKKMRNFIFASAILAIAAPTFAGPSELNANFDGSTSKAGLDWQNPMGDLYDNGDHDGVNGYSAAHEDVFGSRRSLLDDFTVPAGGWNVGSVTTMFIWNSGLANQGTDMQVVFYADEGNCTPGLTPVCAPVTATYTETATGEFAFSREIMELVVTFEECCFLEEGHYWVDLLPVGPENGFILTTSQKDCECWVDYADFSGRAPGNTIFGVSEDIMFCLGSWEDDFWLDLTVDNLIAGETAIFTLSGGTPGAVGAVLYDLQLGSFSGTFDGWCFDFGLNIANLGEANSQQVIAGAFNGSGVLQAGQLVPGQALGATVSFQGLEKDTCPDVCMSNIVTMIVN